jgi:hypothetical protein
VDQVNTNLNENNSNANGHENFNDVSEHQKPSLLLMYGGPLFCLAPGPWIARAGPESIDRHLQGELLSLPSGVRR